MHRPVCPWHPVAVDSPATVYQVWTIFAQIDPKKPCWPSVVRLPCYLLCFGHLWPRKFDNHMAAMYLGPQFASLQRSSVGVTSFLSRQSLKWAFGVMPALPGAGRIWHNVLCWSMQTMPLCWTLRYKIGMSNETPPVPETFSDIYRSFVHRCLQRDPDERLAPYLCSW